MRTDVILLCHQNYNSTISAHLRHFGHCYIFINILERNEAILTPNTLNFRKGCGGAGGGHIFHFEDPDYKSAVLNILFPVVVRSIEENRYQ